MAVKKPYVLVSREFGRGSPYKQRFSTLKELAKVVLAYWQGCDYVDGPAEFHTDYTYFVIEGATLNDLGTFSINRDDEYAYREFHFHQHLVS